MVGGRGIRNCSISVCPPFPVPGFRRFPRAVESSPATMFESINAPGKSFEIVLSLARLTHLRRPLLLEVVEGRFASGVDINFINFEF